MSGFEKSARALLIKLRGLGVALRVAARASRRPGSTTARRIRRVHL